MKFENELKIKVRIYKVFCGFNHCYAVSVNGDIFGWGNPKNFRLTGDFGDFIPKAPKLLIINWKSDKTYGESELKNDAKKPQVDERKIIEMLNQKNKMHTIPDIFVYFY